MARRHQQGYSLIELVAVMAIMAILAAIAVPLYTAQTARANTELAQTYGSTIASEVAALIQDYTSLGTSAPATNTVFISLNPTNGDLAVTPGTGSVGGDGSTLETTVVTAETTIVASGYAAGTVNWCFAVDYRGRRAVYTQAGLQTYKTTCAANGTPG